MSNDKDDLLILTLNNINQKVDNLDGKLDRMQETLVKNTVTLDTHESRSTASEERLAHLEERQVKIEKKADRIHGFFFYGGAILTTLGVLTALFHDVLSAALSLMKK